MRSFSQPNNIIDTVPEPEQFSLTKQQTNSYKLQKSSQVQNPALESEHILQR